ncbi:MAG TPA: hypothetical protein VN765_12615 [Candidatus Acidoferrum sp.]|nr:hypothetical protein [Candidatus Acidoferrum sp.]
MKTARALLTLTLAALALAARAGFVYETPREFLSCGDFNGDGIADILVLDKLTGNARVGYGDGLGGLSWSAPLLTGVENVTGCGVQHWLQTNTDAIAVTSPNFNQVNLVDLSQTNSAGAPQTFAPPGLGPHALAGLGAPSTSISPGVPFLLVASSFNDASAEQLDLLQWISGSTFGNGSFNESGPFDLAEALDISNTPTLATGLVRGATNDTLHLWEFDGIPGVVGAFSNLPAGSSYVFGTFNNEPLPRFIFYQSGASNLAIVPLLYTNPVYSFGPPLVVNLDEAVQQVVFLTDGALIQFGDGVQGLTLPAGSAVLSSKYQSGAGAAGNVFTGALPLTNGEFVLLDAAPGASSAHAQVIAFDGTTFTPRSGSNLPLLSSRNSRANVWLFQLEPFVNRAPGFVASLNAPDWADGVSGLPGAVQVASESDSGATSGLGNAATNNLGAAPGGAAFGFGNQYNPAISVFSFSAPHAAEPINVTISPPPGSYGSPLSIQFASAPAGTGVRYRASGLDVWHDYLAAFSITNDTTVQFYGTNAAGGRASLQFASYALGVPYSPPPTPPVLIDPANTNTPPVLATNEVVLSHDGTLFYGRRSPANGGTIWAINLDGSSDTYITTGWRPRASSDGRWLAFLRNGNQIWLRDLAAGAERLLATAPGPVTGFGWETNNTTLVTDYGCAIGDLDTNGGFTSLLTGDCFNAAPARSPDGAHLAFHNLNPTNGAAGIFVDGQLIVTAVFGATWPSWSPDSSNLVFCDNNDTNGNSGQNLWMVNPDGSGLIQISDFTDPANGFPHGALWSPDAQSLVGAGTVFDTNGLWVIPLRADRHGCDGPPYLLPTTPGDPIDFAGSIALAPVANAFIGTPPGLFIRQDPANVVVYWNTNFVGFTLESQPTLPAPSSWNPVGGPFYLNGAYFEYWEANTNLQAATYFRLHYTGAAVVLSQH